MQVTLSHGLQYVPMPVWPASATVAEGALSVNSLRCDGAKSIGSRKMQTAAKNNLFLTDASSKQLFEIKNSGRLYQQIAPALIRKSLIRGSLGEIAVSTLADALVSIADHAYFLRDLSLMSAAADALASLGTQGGYRGIGLYYEAISFARQGKGTTARSLFERSALEAAP